MRTQSRLSLIGIAVALICGFLIAPGMALLAVALLAVFHFGRRTPKLIACVGFFSILGPLVGFVVFWIAIAIEGSGAALSDVLGAAAFGAIVSAALFPLALPVGAPPALLTGLFYFAVRRRAVAMQGRGLAVTLAIAAGAATSALWTAAVFEDGLSVLREAGHWGTFAVPGAVGALVCALAAERFVFSSNASARATVA